MKQPTRYQRHAPYAADVAPTGSTREEIAHARAVLDALIAFLEEARRALEALPPSEAGRPVATSTQMLETILENARSNLSVTPARRMTPKRAKHAVHGGPSTAAEVQARELCDLINSSI